MFEWGGGGEPIEDVASCRSWWICAVTLGPACAWGWDVGAPDCVAIDIAEASLPDGEDALLVLPAT